jgi:ribosomal protein S18 acetylase RimI-like enzyme
MTTGSHNSLQIRPFQPSDEPAVVSLWRQCGLTRPWNNPHLDIERKLRLQPDWFLVGCLKGEVVATAMVGCDGHRGWVNYLGVAPAHQRQGYGRLLMEEAERLLRSVGCPKLNLQVRAENEAAVAFYQRLGYQVEQIVSLGKRLIPDA